MTLCKLLKNQAFFFLEAFGLTNRNTFFGSDLGFAIFPTIVNEIESAW